MISILLPTRQRVNFVIRAINSIVENAHSASNYEIIFGIDKDDQNSADQISEYINSLNRNVNFKIVLCDRYSYKGFHLYLNEMFKFSSGQLLWTYPDDVEIITKNWDLILKENVDELYVMVDLGSEWASWPFSIIPIISRKWIETTNRFSENSQSDLWLGEIAKELNIIKKVNLSCHVFNPSNGSQHNIEHYFSKMVQDEKHKDIEKLKCLTKTMEKV
jgi:hypothetical protein